MQGVRAEQHRKPSLVGPLAEAMPVVVSRVKRMVKRIPGTVRVFEGMRRLYVRSASTLGYVVRKDAVVSRAYWERRAAERWDADCQAADDEVYRRALGELIREFRGLSWRSLLEVGCGFGRVLKALRAEFPHGELVGGDFSFNQLRHGQTYLDGQRVGLVQVEACRLPFTDRQFDVVLTAGVLIYLHPDQLEQALRELRRVARRYLVLVENARDCLDTPCRKRLLRDAPFYAHDYTAALGRVKVPTMKVRLMQAWSDHPRQLPQTLIIGQRDE